MVPASSSTSAGTWRWCLKVVYHIQRWIKRTWILWRCVIVVHLNLEIRLGGEGWDVNAGSYFLVQSEICVSLETVVVGVEVGSGNDIVDVNGL